MCVYTLMHIQQKIADQESMETGEGEVEQALSRHVVAMPYPGRGHINPMLNLCKLLASRSTAFTINVILTEEWVGLIGSRPESDPPNIRLRTIPNVIPSEHNRAADLPGFVEAVFTKMEAPFVHLLDQLLQLESPPVSCIMYDTFLTWVPSVASSRGIPVVSVCPVSPSVFSIFHHFDLLAVHGHSLSPEVYSPERREEIIDYIPGVSSMRLDDLPPVVGFQDKICQAVSLAAKSQAMVFTSSYEIQAHATDTLIVKLSIPIYNIGPSIPYMSLRATPPRPVSGTHADYLDWLDSQPDSSVLFVSLGSVFSTSKEQMHELLMGLLASGVRFMWIARNEASRLQEACGEMGLIVPWCDQLRVLCHSSISGFLTHCGWNSTMERIYAGVPMLTFPLTFDQVHNSKLIVEDWRIGLRLRCPGVAKDVSSEETAHTVKRLMDSDGEGKELRIRAKHLQETCRRAIETGGSTDKNIDAFVRDFVQGQCHGTV